MAAPKAAMPEKGHNNNITKLSFSLGGTKSVSTLAKGSSAGSNWDIDPVSVVNPRSRTPALLVCEHASYQMPSDLENLGLSTDAIKRHIGWDIGALAVATQLVERLQAELVYQNYSRLIIDCNRPLTSEALIPNDSEGTPVPGNANLSPKQRQQRIDTIWQPFQDAVGNALDRREERAVDSVLIAVHSFNKTYLDDERPWHICLAYNRDERLARLLEEELVAVTSDYTVALNKPFFVEDAEDQTIPVFGEQRDIPHVLLEIRNDLIEDESGQHYWGMVLANAIQAAIGKLEK